MRAADTEMKPRFPLADFPHFVKSNAKFESWSTFYVTSKSNRYVKIVVNVDIAFHMFKSYVYVNVEVRIQF